MIPDSSARFCPFCGKPVAAPDTAFCAYCGRALLTARQPPSAAPTPVLPSVPATPPTSAMSGPIGYGTAVPAPTPAQSSVMPMGAGSCPAQPGMPAPMMSAPYTYASAGMARAAPASAGPGAGRMIGVMLGVVGVLLILTATRLYLYVAPIYRLWGHDSRAYTMLPAVSSGVAILVLVVPFCYWLALLRLRVVSLVRLVSDVLATGVVFIVVRAFILDMVRLLTFRGIAWYSLSFFSMRFLLSGEGFLFGVVLPLLVGAGISVGAAILCTQWNAATRSSAQMQDQSIRHYTLVCGSFAGFVLLDVFLFDSIFAALDHARAALSISSIFGIADIVVNAVFAVCVVIVASVWVYQMLRAVPAYRVAVPGAEAAQPARAASYASPAGASLVPVAPAPVPPVPPSGAPMAAPQQEPARQTSSSETQA